jgi:hypothetical protein
MNTQQFVTETRQHFSGGEQVIYRFPNGYGASVIPVIYYNTGETVEGYREVAVLDAQGDLTYDTPVTDDTVRVTVEELPALLERIAGL